MACRKGTPLRRAPGPSLGLHLAWGWDAAHCRGLRHYRAPLRDSAQYGRRPSDLGHATARCTDRLDPYDFG